MNKLTANHRQPGSQLITRRRRRSPQGHDAFQHEVYGDEITLERKISGTGPGSGYLLKDCRGRIQGRRRDDLDALLATLGINAANPVAVMTQVMRSERRAQGGGRQGGRPTRVSLLFFFVLRESPARLSLRLVAAQSHWCTPALCWAAAAA